MTLGSLQGHPEQSDAHPSIFGLLGVGAGWEAALSTQGDMEEAVIHG